MRSKKTPRRSLESVVASSKLIKYLHYKAGRSCKNIHGLKRAIASELCQACAEGRRDLAVTERRLEAMWQSAQRRLRTKYGSLRQLLSTSRHALVVSARPVDNRARLRQAVHTQGREDVHDKRQRRPFARAVRLPCTQDRPRPALSVCCGQAGQVCPRKDCRRLCQRSVVWIGSNVQCTD